MAVAGVLDETPTALIPKMNEFPVSNSAYYQKLVLADPATGADDSSEFTGRLDVFGKDAREKVDAARPGPAVGVLLTFEQGWVQKGLALGELRKSLSLAPGEVTRLAMVDWRRTTRSRDEASRDQSEQVREQLDDSATLNVVQEAVANEQRTGHSSNMGTATHVEGSANASFLLWGGSTSSSASSHFGLAASASTGRRDVASAAVKDVERSTEQSAQSIRSARATQIREVSETESQTTTTRVVANYNHAHALTMQYYEVLQIYALETRVIRAERCVFVPMKSFDFTLESLRSADARLIELLRRVLRDLNAQVLDEIVGAIFEHGQQEDDIDEKSLVDYLNDIREQEEGRLTDLETELQSLNDELPIVQSEETDAVTMSAQGVVHQSSIEARLVLDQRIALLNARISLLSDAASHAVRALGVLAKNRLLLNQQIFMRIEDYDWHRLLAGKVFPRAPYKDQAIGGVADPTPVGYFGNYVAFKWDFPRLVPTGSKGSANRVPQGDEAKLRNKEIARMARLKAKSPSVLETAAEFESQFTTQATTRTQISLPTEGLFAESVLGRSNSAEKIDMARFWNWQDSPIPVLPPSMRPVDTESRARGVESAPPFDFEKAIVELRKIDSLPEGVDDAALIGALKNAIGNSDAEVAAASNAARAAGDQALAGANRAGQTAIDLQKQFADFRVDLANSKAAVAATEIGLAAATGGTSAVAKGGLSKIGGLLNQARKVPATPGDSGGEA